MMLFTSFILNGLPTLSDCGFAARTIDTTPFGAISGSSTRSVSMSPKWPGCQWPSQYVMYDYVT